MATAPSAVKPRKHRPKNLLFLTGEQYVHALSIVRYKRSKLPPNVKKVDLEAGTWTVEVRNYRHSGVHQETYEIGSSANTDWLPKGGALLLFDQSLVDHIESALDTYHDYLSEDDGDVD